MACIRVTDISKTFNLNRRPPQGKFPIETNHTVIDNISFEVRVGECVGIVGRNGCGKTTLLRLLAGILQPDCGKIEAEGSILALIELSTGIEEELSGRENLFHKGAVHGLTRKEIKEKMPKMIAFSGLKDFIDVPVKQYSDGMKMRLAFTITVEIPHDILLIDEISAVGDKDFQNKCIAKLEELRLQGKTFVMVSHQMDELIERCDRVIFLDEGKIVADGPPRETIQIYLNHMVQHHLHNLKTDITKGLTKLENLKPPEDNPQQHVRESWSIRGWLRSRRKCTPTYDETMKELTSLITEFQCLINARSDYLIQELENLQDKIYGQEQLKGLNKVLRGDEECKDEYQKVEKELRWMLEEKQFLLTVKIQMGHKPSMLAADRHRLTDELRILLDNETNNDRDSIRKMHLELLRCQLKEERAVETALPLIRDYAGTCCDLMKSNADVQLREDILETYLAILKEKFEGGAEKDLWIVERLLETTSEVFKADVLNPTEGEFLVRYVRICKDALLKFDDVPQKRIEFLGHLLREGIQVVEHELLDISLHKSPGDSKRQTTLDEIKQQLLYALSELYSSFRTTDIPAGKGWGFGDAEIKQVSLLAPSGNETETFRTGDQMSVLVRFVLKKPLTQGIRLGITIHHETGIALFTPDTLITEQLTPGVEKEIKFILGALPLAPGKYPLTVALYDPLLTKPYDHRHQAYVLTVVGDGKQNGLGLLNLEHNWAMGPEKDCQVNPEQ